ncbi:MAG: hypothetical protein ACRECY_02695, partial [Phyllobacterium sp.]
LVPIDEVLIEHPEGMLRISVETESAPYGHREIKRLSTIRTARRIFEGSIILPSGIWPSDM